MNDKDDVVSQGSSLLVFISTERIRSVRPWRENGVNRTRLQQVLILINTACINNPQPLTRFHHNFGRYCFPKHLRIFYPPIILRISLRHSMASSVDSVSLRALAWSLALEQSASALAPSPARSCTMPVQLEVIRTPRSLKKNK